MGSPSFPPILIFQFSILNAAFARYPRAMSWFYRTLIRPALFTQDSEEIHNRTLAALGRVSRHENVCDTLATFYAAPALPVDAFGLLFPNPVGLAAGMDKQAAAAPVWPALGFGFSELGGVTWHAQPGNPAPRMFRAVADEALINRMGFNNSGAEALAERLANWRALGRWPSHPVGINLGKSRITSLEQAAEDYSNSLRLLWPHADFFVVNVSSPNTPNLRQLQDKAALDNILVALQKVNGQCAAANSEHDVPSRSTPGPKPILVKVAPDLSLEALDEILDLVGPRQLAGLVATNTTIARPATADAGLQRIYSETGGLSGKPLRSRSTEIICHLHRQTRGKLPIIGVGGIFTAADAWEKITAGATLIQIYTGLVYEGPAITRDIVTGLKERMKERGMTHLVQAVGNQSASGQVIR
jgi:dihydroorotate dehydrogenase